MVSKKIENSIIKYLNHQASISELEELEDWLENSENEIIFREYVKLNYAIDFNLKEYNLDKTYLKLGEIITKSKKAFIIRRIKKASKYAAAILIILSLSLYYFNNNQIEINNKNSISNQITLRNESGSTKILDVSNKSSIKDSNGKIIGYQNKETITYDNNTKIDRLIYNSITVPYGKTFVVNLSDGTKVNLNAGTTLTYPIKFLKGKERKVFIENGEAFFNVTKDINHPFIVSNNNFDIKVLGTQFNISSYPEDKEQTTVLVEGSIQVLEKNNSLKSQGLILSPGFKASLNKESKKINISKADIEMHTAWLSGKIILKHMKFSTILKRLERKYNVTIKCNDELLNKEFITATFEDETIEEVMRLLNKIHPMNYSIKNRSIVISKNKIR